MTWATEHASWFLDQAVHPWTQEEDDRETDAAMAEDDAMMAIANDNRTFFDIRRQPSPGDASRRPF